MIHHNEALCEYVRTVPYKTVAIN